MLDQCLASCRYFSFYLKLENAHLELSNCGLSLMPFIGITTVTVISYFVNSGTKFWLLMNQVDVNMRTKEETLGFETSLKMYFHFYMKIILDMTGSEDIY